MVEYANFCELRDAGQVEADHGQGGVESDGARPVEESLEVAGDQAAQGVADHAAVFGQAAVMVVAGVRGQDAVDDHGQDRHLGAAYSVG